KNFFHKKKTTTKRVLCCGDPCPCKNHFRQLLLDKKKKKSFHRFYLVKVVP
ncbi:Hypothetical protein FKW44_024147, partial [Caligus rogercresseyi]